MHAPRIVHVDGIQSQEKYTYVRMYSQDMRKVRRMCAKCKVVKHNIDRDGVPCTKIFYLSHIIIGTLFLVVQKVQRTCALTDKLNNMPGTSRGAEAY